LEAADGSKIGLTVTVTAVNGSDVKFNIKVDNK
jgi:predicted thioesterase